MDLNRSHERLFEEYGWRSGQVGYAFTVCAKTRPEGRKYQGTSSLVPKRPLNLIGL
jgi:hypothetical protein